MRTDYGKNPVSGAVPLGWSCTTLCFPSPERPGGAITVSSFRYAHPVTGEPMAFMGWGLNGNGPNATISTPGLSRSRSGASPRK